MVLASLFMVKTTNLVLGPRPNARSFMILMDVATQVGYLSIQASHLLRKSLDRLELRLLPRLVFQTPPATIVGQYVMMSASKDW